MITTIISYCSLDRTFIERTIEQSLLFSDDIIVVSFDHLLSGQPEDLEDIAKLGLMFPYVRFLTLPFSPAETGRYHHNMARWIGTHHSRYGWILYLDSDEIPDGLAVRESLLNWFPVDFDAASFECYWYFRRPEYQAIQTEECGLLFRKSAVLKERMFTEHERWAFRYVPNLRFTSMARGASGVLMHHYSWVRSEANMLAKIEGWGHKNDRDWETAVREEFKHEFNGRDFVHGYSYRLVPNKFNISL